MWCSKQPRNKPLKKIKKKRLNQASSQRTTAYGERSKEWVTSMRDLEKWLLTVLDSASLTHQRHDTTYGSEDKWFKVQFQCRFQFSLNCSLPKFGFFSGLTTGHSELRQQSQRKLQLSDIRNMLVIIYYLIQSTHTFILIYFHKRIKHSFILPLWSINNTIVL